MKYIDADRLKAEIERRKNQDVTFRERNILIDIEMAIDSLQQEQPEEDLEEAAKQFVGYDMDTARDYEVGIKAFIAGAEWAMKRKEDKK